MRHRALILSIPLLLLACGGEPAADDAGLHGDIVRGRDGAEVTFDAILLDSPIESGGHERFHVRSGGGDVLEVDHNTTLARAVPAQAGDRVVIRGRLYVDPRPGVHCTHAHTSHGCPVPGWIRRGSQVYE